LADLAETHRNDLGHNNNELYLSDQQKPSRGYRDKKLNGRIGGHRMTFVVFLKGMSETGWKKSMRSEYFCEMVSKRIALEIE
jgi:hypothetical protein